LKSDFEFLFEKSRKDNIVILKVALWSFLFLPRVIIFIHLYPENK